MNYSMLDLGAGLGGGSESMLNNGWDVQRVDKNPLLSAVPNMTIRNINQLADELEKHISEGNYPHSPTLVWHSPDCTEFSRGFNAPGPKAQREGKKFIPDLQQMQTGKFIIDTLRPQWWIIENVVGAIPWWEISPYLRRILATIQRQIAAHGVPTRSAQISEQSFHMQYQTPYVKA